MCVANCAAALNMIYKCAKERIPLFIHHIQRIKSCHDIARRIYIFGGIPCKAVCIDMLLAGFVYLI